jgi:hypothetical protein
MKMSAKILSKHEILTYMRKKERKRIFCVTCSGIYVNYICRQLMPRVWKEVSYV